MKPTSTTLLAVEELHRASRKSSTAMPACRRTARSVPSAKSLVWRGRVTLRPVPGWRHTSWLPGPSRSNSYPNRLRRRATSRYLKPASRPTRGPERPRASPLSPYSQRPLESCAIQQDPRSLSESWSRDYEVSEPRGPPRRPPGSVAHSRVPKQGLREGLRLFGRDRDASNTLQRVSGARSGATARPPGRTDPTYPPARAYSRFRFHAVHTRLHSPSAPRNPRR